MALGVGDGDQVAVTSYSWPATANAIRAVGAEPVFVDIDRDTFNMSVAALEQVLRAGSRMRAVLPVHTFGGSADMQSIVELATKHGLPVVEDAACALGTEQRGRRAGSIGKIGCFSLHPRKAITTGEGGMLTTDDPAIARTVKMLRNHGQDPDAPKPDFVTFGFNLRMTEFQGAMGLTQLAKAERIIAARRACAQRYDAMLGSTEIQAPRALPESRHVYQSYVVLLPADLSGRRDAVIAAMKQRGVETTLGTYHMPLIRYYRERGSYKPGQFPVTDDVAARAMTLPLYEGLTPEQQQTVIATLRESLAAVRAG
jgi:dTDP-4-amino-4,6-dideoxygalactose transaminase